LQSLPSRRKEVETDKEGNQLRWIHDRAALKARFKKLSDGEENRLIANAKKGAELHERRSAANEYDVGGADAWAFGNTAFRIFYGRELTTIDRFKLYRRPPPPPLRREKPALSPMIEPIAFSSTPLIQSTRG
ncbi:MAG TPA: hypothetical protein VF226_22230, partial [Hyphomicrobiaceae bacterium]